MIIKGIIFAYVIIAMGYYFLTVCLFASKKVEDSIIDIMPLCEGDSLKDVKEGIDSIVNGNDILWFLFISVCGLIGGFGLPIIILSKVFKRG